MLTSVPTISVCCITYNHEAFLAQAIESVLEQQTDFAVEMVIGEDCSPDGTRAIAQAYEKRYPGRVRVLVHDRNLGIMPNLMATMAACKGEFIAFLEGDDYWTDPTKLQRQVEALRANSDCAFCFHDAEVLYEFQPGRPSQLFSEQAAHALPSPGDNVPLLRFTQIDLVQLGWIVPSASMLFRAVSLPQPLPDWFAGVYSGDFTLHLLSTRWGPALYLPRVMSHYRLHTQSISIAGHKSIYQYERRIYEGKMFKEHVFDIGYKRYGDIYLAGQYRSYANYHLRQGNRKLYLTYLLKYLYLSRQRIPLYLMRRVHGLLRLE